jgi:hypothetical protein
LVAPEGPNGGEDSQRACHSPDFTRNPFIMERSPQMATRQSDDSSIPTVTQVKETLEALIESNDRRYTIRDEYQKDAVKVALESNNRRLDSMNEFRSALADQGARMITREETGVIHQALVDKADESAKVLNLRLDAEMKPIHSKLDEIGRPNWALLASLISIAFVFIAGIWLVIGLKIDASLIPVSLALENLKVQGALDSETTRTNAVGVAASTRADEVSRTDRSELNARMQLLEGVVATTNADRRSAEARTSALLVEIETQFKSASVVQNIEKDDAQRLLGLLWSKVYPGESLPQANYRPSLYREK